MIVFTYTHTNIHFFLSICKVTNQSMKKYYHMIVCHNEITAVHLLELERKGRERQCDTAMLLFNWVDVLCSSGPNSVLSVITNCLMYFSILYENITQSITLWEVNTQNGKRWRFMTWPRSNANKSSAFILCLWGSPWNQSKAQKYFHL